MHLLTEQPKLTFRGALKEALMAPEDRSYQTQYFAKIFSSSLALTLQILFTFSFRNHLRMRFE